MNYWHSTKQNQTAPQLVKKWQCFLVIVWKSITAFLSLREEIVCKWDLKVPILHF